MFSTAHVLATALHVMQLMPSNARAGFKVYVLKLDRVNGSTCTGDALKDALNPLIRQYWSTYADGLVDLAEDATLGADGACTGASFQSDTYHPSTAGHALIAGYAQRALNRQYGNRSFSEATTHTSGYTMADQKLYQILGTIAGATTATLATAVRTGQYL